MHVQAVLAMFIVYPRKPLYKSTIAISFNFITALGIRQ